MFPKCSMPIFLMMKFIIIYITTYNHTHIHIYIIYRGCSMYKYKSCGDSTLQTIAALLYCSSDKSPGKKKTTVGTPLLSYIVNATYNNKLYNLLLYVSINRRNLHWRIRWHVKYNEKSEDRIERFSEAISLSNSFFAVRFYARRGIVRVNHSPPLSQRPPKK